MKMLLPPGSAQGPTPQRMAGEEKCERTGSCHRAPQSLTYPPLSFTKPSTKEHLHTPTTTSSSPSYRLLCGQHIRLLHCHTRGPDGPLDLRGAYKVVEWKEVFDAGAVSAFIDDKALQHTSKV